MMKKIAILTMAMLLGAMSLWARPGYTKPVDVLQPDGTTITLLMHGDEYLSFMTTTDGYTVVKGEDGYYRYAEKHDGKLRATTMKANNPGQRETAEQTFLAATRKMLQPAMTAEAKELKAMASQMVSPKYGSMNEGQRRVTPIWDPIDYDHFKGLVVLVEFSNRKFQIDNPQEFYQRMTSEKNLVDNTKKYYPVDVTGSARDYFYDNSLGKFDPTFDVVGPVSINYSDTYIATADDNGNIDPNYMYRMIDIIEAVMTKVNSTVDLTNYDLNNDGVIDIVYFIFAGYGSYVQGNNPKYLWPHANDLTTYARYYRMKYDNKYFGRYACSVEIQDYEDYANYHVWYDGIGTICHEFSHVLGLSDHYDTDYEENGQAITAGAYDVMDGGADHNYGLTPAGYNSFERHVLGFADPAVLDTAGSYTLKPFDTSNEAYRVLTSKTDEEFYIENRQKQGWDTYLPDHGMLVWRADCSKPSVWTSNSVNISPSNMYFELLGNAPISDYDLTAETNDVWNSKGAAIDLYSISEDKDGTVSFDAGKIEYETVIEDFESMAATTADASGVEGKFCSWDLTNAFITATSGSFGSGAQLLKFQRSGTATTSALSTNLHSIEFTVQTGNRLVTFYVKQKTADSDTWETLKSPSIKRSSSNTILLYNIPADAQLQLSMTSSSSDAVCYVDDIKVSHPQGTTDIQAIPAVSQESRQPIYNLSGQRVSDSYKGLVIKNGKKYIVK